MRFEIFMMVNFGKIFNTLMESHFYIASPYVYTVMIIDWFQPFKLTQASIGAIY